MNFFPTEHASWAKAAAKSRRVTGALAAGFFVPVDAETSGGKLHHGFCGMVVDYRGVKPVREINGHVLPDQQVRWSRPPPGIEPEPLRWVGKKPIGFDPERTDSRTTRDSVRSDFEQAFTYAKQAFTYAKYAKYDQQACPTPNEKHKRALQLLIATLPKGSKERADAEKLLGKIIEQEGG